MTNSYLTIDELRALFPDQAPATSYEALLTSLIARASRAVDHYTRREPGAYQAPSTAAARYFDGSGTAQLWVDEMAAAPTAVAVAETGDVDDAGGTGGVYTPWATSDYLLWPPNALAQGAPILRLDVEALNGSKTLWYAYPRGVKITAKWGYCLTPPDDVLMATGIMVVRLFKRAQQGFQDTGAIPELSQLRYTRAMDSEVEALLAPWVRVIL